MNYKYTRESGIPAFYLFWFYIRGRGIPTFYLFSFLEFFASSQARQLWITYI